VTTSLVGTRRFLGWSLLATVSLLVVLLTWNLVGLNQNLSRLSGEVSARALVLGDSLRDDLARRDFQAPAEAETSLLRPDRDPTGTLYPRQICMKLGQKVLWAVPPYAPPFCEEPAVGESRVEPAGASLWTYSHRLPDGRWFLATFEAPGYTRSRSRTSLLAVFEVIGAGVLILFWALLAWRLYASYQEVVAAASLARDLLPGREGEASTQDMLVLFQRMVTELRAKTAELEDRSAAQKRRAESVESMVEALAENLGAGYLRFDPEGRLSGTNADARRLLGLPTVPLLGDTDARALGDNPAIRELLREVHESRSVTTRDEVPGADGRLLQAVAMPLFDKVHHPLGHLLVLRDLTEFYRMGRTLREREALSRLGEVAAGVAHEVRNGLNVLTLQLRNLEADHAALADDTRLRAVRDEIAQLEQVVQELLFFAKPLRVEKAPVSARELLGGAADRLRALFPGLAVEVRAGGELLLACDAEPLGRALLNLGRNAAEAATAAHPGAGRVLLAAAQSVGETELRVEDDGPGLAPEVRENLFAPFASQKPGGTGLGLPIARKIAREHGGDLVPAQAETLPGAAFVLTLPA